MIVEYNNFGECKKNILISFCIFSFFKFVINFYLFYVLLVCKIGFDLF